jgi:hypothetical protein
MLYMLKDSLIVRLSLPVANKFFFANLPKDTRNIPARNPK